MERGHTRLCFGVTSLPTGMGIEQRNRRPDNARGRGTGEGRGGSTIDDVQRKKWCLRERQGQRRAEPSSEFSISKHEGGSL